MVGLLKTAADRPPGIFKRAKSQSAGQKGLQSPDPQAQKLFVKKLSSPIHGQIETVLIPQHLTTFNTKSHFKRTVQ